MHINSCMRRGGPPRILDKTCVLVRFLRHSRHHLVFLTTIIVIIITVMTDDISDNEAQEHEKPLGFSLFALGLCIRFVAIYMLSLQTTTCAFFSVVHKEPDFSSPNEVTSCFQLFFISKRMYCSWRQWRARYE